MANYVNVVEVPNGGTFAEPDPNPGCQAVLFRVLRPQPFNAGGVVTNRPTSGQMWPRGRE